MILLFLIARQNPVFYYLMMSGAVTLIFSLIISLKYIEKVDFFFILAFFMVFPGFVILQMNTPTFSFDEVAQGEYFEAFDEVSSFLASFFGEASLIAASSTVFLQKTIKGSIKKSLLGSAMVVILFSSLFLSDMPYLPILLQFNYLFITLAICFFLVAINENGLTKIEYRKIINILHNELDPAKYIEEIEKFNKKGKYKSLNLNGDPKVDLGVGFLAIGNFDKAICLFQEVLKDSSNEYTWFLASYQLSSIYLSNNEIDLAKPLYKKMQETSCKNNNKQETTKYIMSFLEAKFHLAQQEYEKALKIYKEIGIKSNAPPISNINIKFDMALAYDGLGLEKDRIACLEYVSEYGNNHYKAAMARELLNELKG